MTPEHKEKIRLGKEAAKTEKEGKFVTKEAFDTKINTLQDTMLQMMDMMKTKTDSPLEKQVSEEKEVAKAIPNNVHIPEDWEEKAKEILGEKLERCELFYPKSGGTQFTVVIKQEYSNAPKEYTERMKVDRRTKEIGQEGIGGVEAWCKLVRSNLNKKLN